MLQNIILVSLQYISHLKWLSEAQIINLILLQLIYHSSSLLDHSKHTVEAPWGCVSVNSLSDSL